MDSMYLETTAMGLAKYINDIQQAAAWCSRGMTSNAG